MPAWSRRPVALTVARASVSRMISRVFTAAAAATRLPAYVPPWLTLSGQDAHDLAPAAERRDRIAVAHRLGVRGQVRPDAEVLGRPAPGEPEAGLDLVEDEQDPELLGERPHRRVEAGLGQDALGIAEDGLDDDRGDVLALALEQAAQEVDVVVAGRDDRLRDGLGMPRPQARRTGLSLVAELGHVVRRDADERVVVDAVVLALELHDLVAAGVAAGDAHRVHRGLGAGHRQARLLDPAGDLADELGGPDLVLAREAEAHAPAHPLVDMVVDPVVTVAQDHRAVAHPQVDELVAVDVPDPAALATVDVDRVLAPGPEVGVGAAGQRPTGSPVHLVPGGSDGGRGGVGRSVRRP